MDARSLIDELYREMDLSREGWLALIGARSHLQDDDREYLYALARKRAQEHYGKDIFLRGLIEFSNFCKNDCFYCGIRRDNSELHRYRLTKDEIVKCADTGYHLNFRTAVLQSGEDRGYSDDDICEIVRAIKKMHPDMAVTLSIGEKEKESYQMYFDAGADRYLLRHETANAAHYRAMHPPDLSMRHRMDCLFTLKEIGYQVGAGFMVGSPHQTDACYADDMRFLKTLGPHMIGIGPFIPHHATPFKNDPPGTLEDTLFFLALLRLAFPKALIPATTALGTIDPRGRELGILAGANVVMPNLSPRGVRRDYLLYDGKICTGDEAAECRRCMELRMEKIGYHVVTSRGDYRG
ncbi:MAG: [FeFe] hydrogenase H-cluster radical SAM maturase HydE [Lachnospiraceae bacterium]|nr:[FeFe] hydrogenase H-cluster radical SAM maturase HydE [Lachnospiraceae bacterium]